MNSQSGGNRTQLWDRRYSEEGHIWGDDPSPTADILLDHLNGSNQRIAEIGFGYGRDLVWLVQNGHHVTGVEESEVGLIKTREQLRSNNINSQADFVVGEFTKAAIKENHFDAIHSHRMLHLLGNNGLVRAFANKAARILKPRGLLCISARDERDFNEDQMRKREDGRVEYTIEGRKGHIINLWNEEMFRKTFEKDFDIDELIQGEEIESLQNAGKMSKFTIMIAYKKATRGTTNDNKPVIGTTNTTTTSPSEFTRQ